jgi:hypothetical protein
MPTTHFRCGLAPSPMSLPPPTLTFGWLLCAHIELRPPTAMAPTPSLLFFVDYFNDQIKDIASPPNPPWSCILPDTTSIAQANLYWIVACIRKMVATFEAKAPPSSLYFLIPLCLPPKTNKSTRTNASLMAHGLCMALGSGGTMVKWHRCSTHREREKSRWVAAAQAGCCVCWVVWLCFSRCERRASGSFFIIIMSSPF